jgi:catechol-2,3-dioxygenase
MGVVDLTAGLAAALASVAQAAPATYQGSADHLVSLAFYLADPEGNGASERMPSLGLGSFTVVLANAAELEAASDRIAGAGLAVTTVNGGVAVDDPWGNTVHLLVG